MDIGKAQLLRGDLHAQRLPLRPPGAHDEKAFVDRCTSCGDCITACPQNVLVAARGGLPELDFSHSYCTFCGECEKSCQPNAITTTAPYYIKADINQSCLAAQGVYCRSCGDSCEPRAIQFALTLGGGATPSIDLSLCTGCGECFGLCPSNAIALNHQFPENREVFECE